MKDNICAMITQVHLWKNGEKSRPVSLKRPCPCGCDLREGKPGVGYLTGSDANGNGFSIWVPNEETYLSIQKAMER